MRQKREKHPCRRTVSSPRRSFYCSLSIRQAAKEATARSSNQRSTRAPPHRKKGVIILGLLPLRDDAQEAVVKDLDGVDVQQPLRGGDKSEVDGVRNGPYAPRSPDLKRRGQGQARPCKKKKRA